MRTELFQYTEIAIPPSLPFPNGQTIYRPYLIADVFGAAAGLSVRCIVWPDSGADQCVFPLSFASSLGFDPLVMPMQMTGGVGNAGNATYYGDIIIQIPIIDEPPITFTTYAGFTEGLSAQGIGLLGQSGFFEKFIVAFDHGQRLFRIEAP